MLVCQVSTNEEGVRVVRYSAGLVDKLAPEVTLYCYFSEFPKK